MKHVLTATLLFTVAACTQTASVDLRDAALQSRMGDAATADPVLQRAFETLEISYAAHAAISRVDDYGLVEGVDPRELSRRTLAQAERGSVDAQNKLGFAYLRGDGLPQDYALARSWFEKAAVGGSTQAMHNLAGMYRHGTGAPADDAGAARWIRKGAELGDTDEQMHLCLTYALGEGVRQDFVLAYAWCNLGSTRNPLDDRLNDVERRQHVAKFLSPAQLAEGQRLSSGWNEGVPLRRETQTTPLPR